jgi:hypothetical protein
LYIGSVYVYTFVGNIWIRYSKILAKDSVADDKFGRSVNIYGTTAMIGAEYDDDKLLMQVS